MLLSCCSCRHRQAQLTGYSSYLELTQQHLAFGNSSSQRQALGGTAASTDSRAVEFLLQLSEALQPLAQQEVAWVLSQAQREQHLAKQPQQDTKLGQQRHQQLDHSDAVNSWDWERLLHQAYAPLLHPLCGQELQQHMQLDVVLAGCSNLLQQLLGVRLLVRPAGQSEVWGKHVKVVLVVRYQQQQQPQSSGSSGSELGEAGADLLQEQSSAAAPGSTVELLGVVYLDVGGGYGTRMLRFTRAESSDSLAQAAATAAGAGAGAAAAADGGGSNGVAAGVQQWQMMAAEVQQKLLLQSATAPAVAVGISGSRNTLQGHRQQQQQLQPQRLLQEEAEDGDDVQLVDAASSSSTGNRSARGNSSSGVAAADSLLLSVAQLWELGHEMGHALHLVLSSR